MKEEVGVCTQCGKRLYCMDGFLNGVYKENRLYCFECEEKLSSADLMKE
ncbi:hypothetical protein [Shouchella shacheensis]|nr:hypothetical protein [Shouchella shacheensis]